MNTVTVFWFGGCIATIVGAYMLRPWLGWTVGGICCFLTMAIIAFGENVQRREQEQKVKPGRFQRETHLH